MRGSYEWRSEPPFFNSKGRYFAQRVRCRESEVDVAFAKDRQLLEYIRSVWPRLFFNIIANLDQVRVGDAPRKIRSSLEIFQAQDAIHHNPIPLGNGDALYQVDTLTGPYEHHPDSFHTLWLMINKGESVASLHNLSATQLQNYHQVLLASLTASCESGQRSYIGFSFSPQERLRHAEITMDINGVPAQVNIALIRPAPQTFSAGHGHNLTINDDWWEQEPLPGQKVDGRMDYEPYLRAQCEILHQAIIAPVMADPMFKDLGIFYNQHFERDHQFPKGAFLMVPKDVFGGKQFAAFMQQILAMAEIEYQKIAHCFVNTELLWQGTVQTLDKQIVEKRLNALLSSPVYQHMGPNPGNFLRKLARFGNPAEMIQPHMTLEQVKEIAPNLVLLGLAYNLIYYLHPQNSDYVVIALHPRWITDASTIETLGYHKREKPVPKDVMAGVRANHIRNAAAHYGKVVEDQRVRELMELR